MFKKRSKDAGVKSAPVAPDTTCNDTVAAGKSSDNSAVCEMLPDTAPLSKRLDDPVYLMCHPQMMWSAYLAAAFKSILQIVAFVLFFGYAAAEVSAFWILFNSYGFIGK